jgi:hypothetical protein
MRSIIAALVLALPALAALPLSAVRADSILDGKLSGDLDGTLGGNLSGALPPVRFNFGTRDRTRVCRPTGTGCTYAELQGQPYDCETLDDGCLKCRALTLQGSPVDIYWGPERGWGYCP